ncbi:MAG: FAD-dependent oxidoreductase [Pirellula sp.]|jgi:protoporphyrinogen oxidase|nr:FAD-dependent oxidoreductase [Pirellula sp.]
MSDNPGKKESWVVVGGGMLGMAVARKLLRKNVEVTILESSPNLGGLASAWSIGDVVWDRFYHVTLLSDQYLRELLSELSLDQEINWVVTKTGFFSNGTLHSLSSSIDFLRFPILNLYQKFRLGGTIFCASKRSDWKQLENVPVEQWLRKWSGNSTFEKIWLPLLKCKLGDAYQRTNAAFIWAYIQRMYAARRSGLKQELFGIVDGGYDRVLNAFQSALRTQGASVRCGAKVTSIELVPRDQSASETGDKAADKAGDKSATRYRIEYDLACRKESIDADKVVVTLPSAQAANLVGPLTAHERQLHSSIEYLGVLCTSLLIEKPLGGYYVTNITDAGFPITGVIEMGAMLPPSKLGGNYLVYLPQYVHSQSDCFREDDETIHERCMSTLERMYPHFSRKEVRAIQTARARYVMSIPTLGYSQKRAPVKCDSSGLYILNSARIVDGTLNVNEILRLVDQEFGTLMSV